MIALTAALRLISAAKAARTVRRCRRCTRCRTKRRFLNHGLLAVLAVPEIGLEGAVPDATGVLLC